jgi:hypothetical protein
MKARTKPYVFHVSLVLGLLLISNLVAKFESTLPSKQFVVVSSYGLKLGMGADQIAEGLPTLPLWTDPTIPSPNSSVLSGDPSTWRHPRISIEKGQVQTIIANQIELWDGTKIRSNQRKELLVKNLGRPNRIDYVSPVRECWNFDDLNLHVHVNTWNNAIEWFTLAKY